MRSNIFISCIIGISLSLSGCATIMGSNTQLIPISSYPSDASISITDENGMVIFKGLTPTAVVLPKSDGSYFGKKNFVVEISKAGYETQIIPVTASVNGWYIAGNYVFGFIVGWFIVDPFNGGMYTLSPDKISPNLGTKMSHNNTSEDRSISIVLIQDVPLHLLKEMKRIN